MSTAPRELWSGRHLRMMARGHWEYAERTKASGVVTIVAVTPDGNLLLVEQARPPVDARVIELPAGLAGDVAGSETEELAAAASRELLEETGYRAERMELLTRGPSSAGLTSEVITFFRAVGLTKETDGGGDGNENIVVHAIPLTSAADWLAQQERAGALVDPKVFAGLWFAK